LTKEQQEEWHEALKKASGYSNLFDFYNIEKGIDEGQFGDVKLGNHKKTGEKVAIKVIKKASMTQRVLDLQRNEIEVLKMCQHPNIVRMVDVFENTDYIFIVLELLQGGDLYDYFRKREFNVSEDRSKEIFRQIANSLFYMHSLGICHRDLKLENIMMTNDSETAKPILIDFGLSKMIGPD